MTRSVKLSEASSYFAFNASLFFVELCFAIEVTSAIVIAPSVCNELGLSSDVTPWIINSYLFTAFVALVLLLMSRRWVQAQVSAAGCLYIGVGLFVAGNLCCAIASLPWLFFCGRIIQGLGGALAMTGELWAACSYYRARITTPLFWAECGTALGIISGPLLGGFLAANRNRGWQQVFALNAVLGLAAGGMALYSLIKQTQPKEGCYHAFRPSIEFVQLVLMQAAVGALAIGAEYLFSDVLQMHRHVNPSVIGWLGLIAAVGSLGGSFFMARFNQSFIRCALLALGGMVFAHVGLSAAVSTAPLTMISLPVLVIGFFMGIANVAIYARISERLRPADFLAGTLWYLLVLQVSYAVGIELISYTQKTAFSGMISEIFIITCSLLPFIIVLIWQVSRDAIFRRIKST